MANSSVSSGPAFRPPRLVVRRDVGLSAYESALSRAGFGLVAGADEAGRGACAGPLVVAACILPPGRRGRIEGLNDSKLLTAAVRERLYAEIVRRAVAYSVVIVAAGEIAPAPSFGAKIRTDFEKHFIRAEVTSVDELVAAGSMDALRAAGKLRVEGREYRVKDGDVVFFRIGKTN